MRLCECCRILFYLCLVCDLCFAILFEKLYELFKQFIRGFRMIILYQFIVVALCELVHAPIDCGVGGVGWGNLKSTAGYFLYAESGSSKILSLRRD